MQEVRHAIVHSMTRDMFHGRVLAVASSIMLCFLVLMAADAPTPTVPIWSIAYLDEGAMVQTIGILADLWAWDDGTENLLLVEEASNCTVRVVCAVGIHSQPGEYIHLGDEIKVAGEVFGDRSGRRLYADSDHVSLLRPSRFVLTVEALAGCWQLFEGDRIDVRGIMMRGDSEGGAMLRGLSTDCSLALACSQDVSELLFGVEVVVSGTLAFDSSSMAVILDAEVITSLR